MSIQAMAWVIDNSQASGPDYAVLLMLANHYNHETGRCNPGYRRIAAEARVSRATVGRSVARLVELGELAIVTPGGGTRTSDYHFPWLSTGWPSVSQRDAEEDLASHEEALASHGPPSSVSPGRDRSLKQNLEPRSAATDSVSGAPEQPQVVTLSDGSRYHPESGDLELADPDTNEIPASVAPSTAGPTDAGRSVIAETRRRLREGSKSRHPSTRGTNGDQEAGA